MQTHPKSVKSLQYIQLVGTSRRIERPEPGLEEGTVYLGRPPIERHRQVVSECGASERNDVGAIRNSQDRDRDWGFFEETAGGPSEIKWLVEEGWRQRLDELEQVDLPPYLKEPRRRLGLRNFQPER